MPEAQKLIAARLDSAPRDAEVLLLSARTAVAGGDLTHAEDMLRRLIDIDAGQLRAYDLLGQIYISQRRLAEAQAEFEQIAGRQPRATGVHTMVATLLQLQDRIPEARKRFEAIVENDAQAAVASNNLAWLYATGGDNLDVALNLAQTAKKQLPDRPEVDDTLGWIYYKKNLLTRAADSFQQSIQKDPSNPLYHFHLGLVKARQEDRSKARRALQTALTLDPTFAEAEEARRELERLGGTTATVGTGGARAERSQDR